MTAHCTVLYSILYPYSLNERSREIFVAFREKKSFGENLGEKFLKNVFFFAFRENPKNCF
jgi:hypothetical protein